MLGVFARIRLVSGRYGKFSLYFFYLLGNPLKVAPEKIEDIRVLETFSAGRSVFVEGELQKSEAH